MSLPIKKWNTADIGKGVCRYKNCKKFVNKSDLGICDMHVYYLELAKINKNHQRPDWKERVKRRHASLRLKVNRQTKMNRPKETPVGVASIQKATPEQLIGIVNSMIREAHE